MRNILVYIFFITSMGPVAAELPAPLTNDDFRPVSIKEASLGQLLFYDPVLSGNKEVACATCHHPKFGTGDGLSLSIGDGGKGIGLDRIVDQSNLPEQRVPRNAQPLFNLGAKQIRILFHDGRVEVDISRPSGLRTPLEEEMVNGFASIVSAQTMFPVLSGDEMAGHYSENEISEAVRRGTLTGDGGAWDLISKRVRLIPEYADQFMKVYDHITKPSEIEFTDISNAIAAFMEFEWRSDTSPYDAVLSGKNTLPRLADKGLKLFYGEAGCVSCHSGALLTDQDFHAMGQPQLGPGKAARFQNHSRDEGRFRVTGLDADKYAFRTPSLRNVALTGPWGHAGAFSNLKSFVSAHADPRAALIDYDRSGVILTDFNTVDWAIMDNPAEVQAIADAVRIKPVTVSSDDVLALVAFLENLTDTAAQNGRLGIPKSVPSGLKVPTP
ncbi:MAG: cytochrome c peroxidase [Amylibacter sp.]|jgi:cytochrome c peroxidase|tara:strand:+ start:130 stop:1449 length:1320 start_codon:yes stop_codon:yes gene_type:complete